MRKLTEVRPEPVLNRRTGELHEFGLRRAYDGAYILELLNASGCWTEDVERALYVLAPLIENNCGDMPVSGIVDLLRIFSEQPTNEQQEQTRALPVGTSFRLRDGQIEIVDRHLRIATVEGERVQP